MDNDSIEERLRRVEREAFASDLSMASARILAPRERRWPWWKRTASRWLTDWAALGTVLVAIVTVIDYLHIDFPLVWARDFHSFQSDQENHFKVLADGQSSLTLSIKTMLLQNVQREIRQMQSDRDQLAINHKPVADYLDTNLQELKNQENAIQVDLVQLRAARATGR